MEELSLFSVEKLRADFDVFPGPGQRFDSGLVERDIYPPLPVMGEYLVWGFRLLESFRAAGVSEVRVVRLPEEAAGAVSAALKLEGRRDDYSWREKEGIAALVETFRLSDSQRRRIERLVQTKGSFLSMIEQYRSLPPELKEMVAADMLDVKTAWTVRELPGEPLSRLAAVAGGMSFSKRREIFVMTYEIIHRDSLEGDELAEFLRRLEKAEDPVTAARRERFPDLAGLEDRFETFREGILSGSGIDLRPPKYFEGSRFSVSFSFESDRQLDRILEKLNNLRENTDELYRLLYGSLRSDIPD